MSAFDENASPVAPDSGVRAVDEQGFAEAPLGSLHQAADAPRMVIVEDAPLIAVDLAETMRELGFDVRATAFAHAPVSDSQRWKGLKDLPLPFGVLSYGPRQTPDGWNFQIVFGAIDFADLTPFESIAWDYQTTFHSARGHPMQTIRHDLEARGLPDAETLRSARDGSRERYVGMVICRQRPGTAKGIIFMTLEDETGFLNVVVWPPVYERFRLLVKTRTFLGLTGRIQNQHGVVHLVADELWIPDVGLAPPRRKSRDFH